MEDLDEQERGRLDTEWAVVVAAREVLNIALRREEPTTYRQAIKFGAAIAPSILAPGKRLLRGAPESELARYFAEMAAAESASTGKDVTRLEYVEREIAKLEQGIVALPDVKLMKSRLKTLKNVRQEIRPKENTENRLIIRDALKVKRNLIVSDEGADYREYDAGNDRVLRIRVLHPDPPEHKLGADLIYEFHNVEQEMVRVAFVQYKLWDGKSLSHDPRMAGQLTRMRSFGCGGLLCQMPPQSPGETVYRFPHCAMFLRPTDRLQSPKATMVSSGLHIPLCIADKSWVKNERDGMSIRRANVEARSVSHHLFEDLFASAFVGSDIMPVAELEELYRKSGLLEEGDTIVIHVQEYENVPADQPPKQKRLKMRRGFKAEAG
jgi:hypothetical protein